MDTAEKRKALSDRLAKAENDAKKNRKKIRDIKQKLKELDRPEPNLSKAQQNSIKIWHGIACLALMKDNPELTNQVKDYLKKNLKRNSLRKILGFPLLEEKKSKVKPNTVIHAQESKLFNRVGPVRALERVDLEVPYPEPADAKERAKAAGAKWDGVKRTWYVPEGFDLTKVEEWLDKKRNWRTYGIL